jgi:hypothetical protein
MLRQCDGNVIDVEQLISFRIGKRRRWRLGSSKIPEWSSLAAIALAHMLTARGKALLRPFRLLIAGIFLCAASPGI